MYRLEFCGIIVLEQIETIIRLIMFCDVLVSSHGYTYICFRAQIDAYPLILQAAEGSMVESIQVAIMKQASRIAVIHLGRFGRPISIWHQLLLSQI